MFTPTEPNSQPEKPKNDNMDDLFSSPPPPKNQGPVDDLFSSPANSGAPDGTPYTPPPAGQQPKRSNPILWIILGVVVAFMCICVVCIAIFGGSIFAVAQNPTFQAGFATVQVVVGTGVASGFAPTALPSDANKKGPLSANQPKTGQLVQFSQDVWTYSGKSGEQITVNVTAQVKQQLLVLGLYDTSGTLLAGNKVINSGNPTQTVSFTLPTDGDYSVLVGAFGGTADASGNYTVTVQSSAR